MSNVNDVRIKNVAVNIGDKERHLRFTLNAFAELEEAYGSVDGAMQALQNGSIKAVRKLIWAGLLHEDEDLTEKAVGNMLDASNLPEFTQALTKALGVAMPVESGTSNPNSKTQK